MSGGHTGLCATHGKQAARDKQRSQRPCACEYPGCANPPRVGSQWCWTHLRQISNGAPRLTPVKKVPTPFERLLEAYWMYRDGVGLKGPGPRAYLAFMRAFIAWMASRGTRLRRGVHFPPMSLLRAFGAVADADTGYAHDPVFAAALRDFTAAADEWARSQPSAVPPTPAGAAGAASAQARAAPPGVAPFY